MFPLPELGRSFLALVVALAPLPLGWALFAVRGRLPAPRAEALLGILIVWCATQTVVGVLLGAIGKFRVVPVVVAALVVLIVGLALQTRSSRGSDAGTPPAPALTHVEQVLAAVFLAATLTLSWNLLVHPTANFDSLSYHLPHIAQWVQTGSLEVVDGFFPVDRYPYGWEVVCALFVVVLGEDLLVALPNLLVWAMLGLAIHALARRLGASRPAALAAALVALTLPGITSRIDAMQVDIALAAFVVGNAAFALSYARERSRRSLLLGFTSAGLIVAVKFTGIFYLAPLLGLWITAALVTRPIAGKPSWSWGAFGGGVVIAVLVAGFWYGRNWIQTGNPLGHFEVTVAGITLFEGPLKSGALLSTSLASLDHSFHARQFLELVARFLGPGVFVLGIFALLAPLSRARAEAASGRLLLAVTVFLVLASAAIYWTLPASASIDMTRPRLSPWTATAFRFAFPFVAALASLAAVGLTGWKPANLVLTGALVVHAAVLLHGAAAAPVQIFGWASSLALVATFSALTRTALRRASLMVAIGIVGLVVVHAARGPREENRRELYGEAYRLLSDEIDPTEAVGVVWSVRSYVFYGRHFERRVEYVARESDDLRAWIRELRDAEVSLVAMGPYHRDQSNWRGMRERAWMGANRQVFTPVLQGYPPGGISLLRFRVPTDDEIDAMRSRPRRPR